MLIFVARDAMEKEEKTISCKSIINLTINQQIFVNISLCVQWTKEEAKIHHSKKNKPGEIKPEGVLWKVKN